MTVRNTFSGIARLKLVRSLIITIYYESLNYCSSTFPSHQRRVIFVAVDGFAPPTHGLAPAALLLSYTTPYIFMVYVLRNPSGLSVTLVASVPTFLHDIPPMQRYRHFLFLSQCCSLLRCLCSTKSKNSLPASHLHNLQFLHITVHDHLVDSVQRVFIVTLMLLTVQCLHDECCPG